MTFKRRILHAAIVAAIAAPVTVVAQGHGGKGGAHRDIFDLGKGGEYQSGDFHNHTTCSDGSTSVKTLTRQAILTQDHDWFIHVGHSGRGPRDCRVDDFLYHAAGGGDRVGLWSNTIDAADIKGDKRFRTITMSSIVNEETGETADVEQTVQDMWRWQMLQEYNFDNLVEARDLPSSQGKTAFLGLEWVVPGHEHSSNSIATGQYDADPNSDAMAQFEYCFARNSDDTSQGGGQGWTCELSAENNQKLIDLFEGREQLDEGNPDYNSTLSAEGINIDDNGEHTKSVAAMLWMQENHPRESFHVQAHIERQGAFLPGSNRGWNVEHIRDMHTVAPEISFGFESQPGHQAQYNRGGYSGGRPTAGFWTYGGTGVYSSAEVSKPGLDFDGNPIDPATTPECQVPGVNCSNVARTVLARPGIRTMWDALLSEGRRYWFFGSSDWHSRGSFGPTEPESTNDFWPGEYQDNFTYIQNTGNPAQDVVDGLRSGNVFVVMGQLIDKFRFEACSRGTCATMGETLKVRQGDRVTVKMAIRDPRGTNKAPYAFDNPALQQVGIDRPVNRPMLQHVDLIYGKVSEPAKPTEEAYYDPLAPSTTRIVRQWNSGELGRKPVKTLTYTLNAYEDSYIRARGSNLPPGTPYSRDRDGNPLADNLRDNIPCDDPMCPPHVGGVMTADLEAWADLWFYANPIFIEVEERKRRGRGGYRHHARYSR